MTKEEQRLEESRLRKVHWKRWGPYLSERQWGTVREDYSANGDAWDYFPHEMARSRAYRWGEDGIGGISDRHQRICFALALWNGTDPILKERLFGLTNLEGNHGEDVKECYFYVDSTPTHSYLKFLYKYPQHEFPYQQLLQENARRGRHDPEFELLDTGIFNENRYFDVFVEYAKADAEDVCIRITAWNRGPDAAQLDLLPTIWFRNIWSWFTDSQRPLLERYEAADGMVAVRLDHPEAGSYWLAASGSPELLFTENDTNHERCFGLANAQPYVKDAFHDYLIHGNRNGVNPAKKGTKSAALFQNVIAPGGSVELRLRLSNRVPQPGWFGPEFERTFVQRIAEADEFYALRHSPTMSDDAKRVQRQALSGLLWSKQSYHYVVKTWLEGDPTQPKPPAERWKGRNHEWQHLYNTDVLSMPDKWEYPWYAAWDLAFHCVALSLVDPDFAKGQLILLLREWYMHPNGQFPAYEWGFDNVNPPLHAWAALRVYKIERRIRGVADRVFLERVFHKLLLNFTWWVNRKDPEGMNVFEGGFLGLDNIGVFDRSKPLPGGGFIEQSDGTSWMAMYSLNLLAIAMELARDDKAYEDVASKFFEHFIYIADAMNDLGGTGIGLWDEGDGIYYDVLHTTDGQHYPLKVRSMVGLIPLLAVETLEPEVMSRLPNFRRRMQWFLEHHADAPDHIAIKNTPEGERMLLAIANRQRLPRILRYMLDENEFLSAYGLRALSKFHQAHPFILEMDGMENRVDYEPAESTSNLFGGNSNWRGPIWFPLNYLLMESLQKYDYFFGESLQVEFPTGSGQEMTLWNVAGEISRRLSRIFLRRGGRRAVFGENEKLQNDPYWKDLLLFYEYFHGENGTGLGASHQTGWTALVAKLLEQSGE